MCFRIVWMIHGKLHRYLAERDKLYAEADTLTEEKDKLEKELLSLTRSKNKDMEDAVNKAQDVLSASELTNEMLLFFIDRVNVYSGMRVEIIYRFSDVLSKKFVKRFHVFVIKFQRICQKVVLFSYVFGCLNVFISPKNPVQTDCHKIATGLLYRQYWRLQAVY